MNVLCFLLFITSFANGQSDTKSSLTFVIDVTRSMEFVKSKVEEHARGIFDAVVRSNESDIENFVLVTFADPVALKTSINNVTITKDLDEFKDALSLTLVSGGDCPEYSMSGIKTAIENSKSGSTIYVFTDASAKDYDTYDRVKDMAIKKEIQIIFVLTGLCSKKFKKEGYDVYTALANDTSGQVFNLHKNNVSSILNWVKYSAVSRRILLKAKSFSPGDALFLNYTTDVATRDTSISVSGCSTDLIVSGPDGKKLKVNDLVHLPDILVVNVSETMPGTHTVAFDCKTKTRLVVTAKSDIQFRHGFSGFIPTTLNDTTVKPSSDEKSYLSIKISGNFRPKTVNFVDALDNVIPGYSLPLEPLNRSEELYVTGLFDTPFSMFRIVVTGLDLDHNATISRIGYTFVEPQNPHLDIIINKKPTVVIDRSPKILIEIGSSLQLKCIVDAYPKPNITWEKDGTILETSVYDYDLPYAYISVHKMTNVNENSTFMCKANNSEGEDKQILVVEAKPKSVFEVLEKPENVTIKYNNLVHLKCKVDAYPHANVTWYKNGVNLSKEDGVTDDGSELMIQHMKLVNEGEYSCNVKNELQEEVIRFEIKISGVETPKIENTSSSLNFKEGTDNTLSCRIEKGTPEPAIHWLIDNGLGKYDEILEATDDEHLILSNINRKQAGKYKCVATNELGTDIMETNVVVEYSPSMMEDENQTLSFLVDSKVILKCLADGVPKPTITWYKDNIPLNSSKFIPNSDNSLEFVVGLDDRGTYKCVAENYHGTAIKFVILEVDTPPSVVIEGDSRQRVDYNGFLQLKCYVQANPAPDIRWTDTTSLRALPAPTSAIKPPYGYASILNITKAAKNTTYQCEAENIHGDHKSSVFIEVGPKTYFNVIAKPLDTIIRYHTDGHLYCNIDAYPPANITWYKGSKKIISKDGFIVTDGTLTFKNMEPFQSGRYTCEAKNTDITKNYEAKVEISGLEPPNILKNAFEERNHKREVEVKNINITLSCKIKKGVPMPTIKWMYKNKYTSKYEEIKEVTNQETYSVTVSGDTLQYSCKASNLLGSDTLKINLKLPVLRPIRKIGRKRRITLVTGTPNELKLGCKVNKRGHMSRPQIKWFYNGTEDKPRNYELLTSEDGERRMFYTSTLKSYNLTYNQRGLYICTATDYVGRQSSDSFIIEVDSPPEILNKDRVIRAVVHDTALRISCNATGHPKPKYKWTHSGIPKEGSDTLTLYNITKRHPDFYKRKASFVCEAYNRVATDYAKFDVIINDYPSLDNPTSTLKIELGKNIPLHCPIPHGYGSHLRWYKNNKKVTDGKLTINNAKVSDAGLYTCRVSDATDSRSANVDLKVVRRLTFTNTDVRANISLGEGEVATLDCNAIGIPNPRVSWLQNDKEISATVMLYEFKMNNARSGIYKCEVTNDFDTISRNFEVMLNECLLNIDPNDSRQPLILTQRFTLPTYKYEDGILYMPQNQSIILTCGTNGTFEQSTYDYVNAFCNVTSNLEIEGNYYFPDLKCNKEITPYVKWTGKTCQGEDSEMVEIGYEIRTKTLIVYEICMDIDNDVPFYTKQIMRLPIAETIPKVAWFEDRLKNNFDAMYDVDEQITWITSTLGFWFHTDDRCVFTQRQLVDPLGVFPGVPQEATFTHLNVVPQWSSCSTINWDDIESRVRKLLKSTDELTVWTGTADKLSLKDSDSDDQDIYLSDTKSRASPSPVSTYLWKVVQNRAKNESLAIIQINVPDMKPSDVKSYIKCRDVCRRTDWMRSPEWSKINQGYVFCCSLVEFEYTFGYRGLGIFGRGRDQLLSHV